MCVSEKERDLLFIGSHGVEYYFRIVIVCQRAAALVCQNVDTLDILLQPQVEFLCLSPSLALLPPICGWLSLYPIPQWNHLLEIYFLDLCVCTWNGRWQINCHVLCIRVTQPSNSDMIMTFKGNSAVFSSFFVHPFCHSDNWHSWQSPFAFRVFQTIKLIFICIKIS